MNRILATSILALGFLTTAAFSDVAVYDGKTVIKGTSANLSATVPVRTIQVVDTATGQSQAIHVLKFRNFVKKFSVAPAIGSTVASITDKKTKKVSTIFSYADTVQEVDAPLFTGSVLLRGQNAKVTIKGTDKVDLPKLLQGNTSVVVKAVDPTENALVLATSVLKLDAKTSKEANDAVPALTLEQVVANLKQELVDGGYTEEESLTGFSGF